MGNIKIIKKLCPAIIPHITHLVNSIIHTEIYPTVLKVSRISPILKPEKRSEIIDSYRPINNLSAVEKIVEEFLKEQLTKFIDQNEIILPDHHGSRKNYSTMTAISCLNHRLINNYNDGLISAVIQTDLSAAFDTVDHETLLKKMEHYSIMGKMNNLLNSFLSNRYQYVSIDGIKSEVVQSLPCSVIQGSKLSALLYTIYINEVTVLYKLMGTDLYDRITQEFSPIKSEIIGHDIIQYVDDTNNVIYGNNAEEVENYSNAYFKLIESFYTINRLKMNPDKSRLMVVCRPNRREETKNFVLKAGNYIIEQKDKIKVLGIYFTSGLSNHANISNIISKVNFRMNTMREAFKFSDKNTKISFLNSMVVSIFRYCSPILIDSEVKMLEKLQTLLMKCTRPILGIKSLKMSTLQIITELKILTVHQLVMKEAIQFIHKVICNKSPSVIFNLFTQSNCKNDNISGVRKFM